MQMMCQYANSNVGSTLIRVTVGYVLTKGSHEKELEEAKQKLDKSKFKIESFNTELKHFNKAWGISFKEKINCLIQKNFLT